MDQSLTGEIKAIAFLNNAVSVDLALSDFEKRGIERKHVAVIMVRTLALPHASDFAALVLYPGKPSSKMLGQIAFLEFYREAASLLKRVENSGTLRDIYIVNNDNLISSHLLWLARSRKDITVTVVAEGLMNFQDIRAKNRQGWRWAVKPLISLLLGLHYRHPEGHLSGAFEDGVDRIVSFAGAGLQAPADKIEIIEYPKAIVTKAANPKIALLVLTGLAHWMPEEKFKPFAEDFISWIKQQGFDKLLVKQHPHVTAGYLDNILPEHEIVGAGLSVEQMAGDLESGTIIGTCCTALATMKMIRPDIDCIDYGSDYYCEHAYDGDDSVEILLRSVGVKIISHETSQRSAAR